MRETRGPVDTPKTPGFARAAEREVEALEIVNDRLRLEEVGASKDDVNAFGSEGGEDGVELQR